MTILVCGEALYDVFFEEERAEGFTLDARIGGSAFNVAIGLGRLGENVGLMTGISEDRLGDKLVATLAAEGVDTSFLARKAATTTLAMVSIDESGSAAYQFYGEGAADRQVVPADLPPAERVAAGVFGCFSLLTRPTGDTFLGFAQALSRAGRLVVVDPNIRPSVEPDDAVWCQRVDAFAEHAALVKASEEDLGHLFGPSVSPLAAAERFLERGVAAVVVTRGAEGAMLVRRSGVVEVPARAASVVDTVGAGDSFLAALLSHLSQTDGATRQGLEGLGEDEARRALSFCVEAAALTCERRGADLPRRSDIAP